MNHLTHPLREDGFIHHWLVAGPQLLVIPDGEYKFNPELRPAVVETLFRKESEVTQPPVEGDELVLDQASLPWHYRVSQDDHLIDLSGFHANSRYLKAWAWAELASETVRDVQVHVFTNGPADVWLNGEHLLRHQEFDYVRSHHATISVALRAGNNALLVRFEQAATRNALFTLAVRLDKVPAGNAVAVRVPTRTNNLARRQALEAAFEQVHLSRDSYGPNDELRVHIPVLSQDQGTVTVALRRGEETIREVVWDTAKGQPFVSLGGANGLRDGEYQVVLAANENRREIKLSVVNDSFSPTPYGTDDERRREALEQIAQQGGLYAEIAKTQLGRWSEVDVAVWEDAIEGINRRKDTADFLLLDLLSMFVRHSANPQFPPALKPKIKACILGFKYWSDEPGNVSMTFGSENHQIQFHTCEILAGQLYPDRIFTNNGQTGTWHREKGERLALAWLQKRGRFGWEEWDSNAYFGADAKILSCLTDLAQTPVVREQARQMLDKLFFSIALNTFKGCFGSTHGRTAVAYIKDARFEPTSGLCRMLWGQGSFLGSQGGAVHLACAESYRLPPVLRDIALDLPEALWSKERQGLDPALDGKQAGGPVDKVTFKTPDYMLCSAQAWKPGERGYQQHIWQATFGPDAVVFVTHPACISENGNQRPNFWAGNATLPRIAQWKNALIAVYKGRDDDWLDFTHAYFPTFAFDEYALENGWAFARKGDGYVALGAANGLNLVTRGDSAWRELRSPGRQNVWVCQMGRARQDGPFAAFQEKVRASPATLEKQFARFATAGGTTLSFGWDEPLRVDDREQPVTGFKHFDNPYCVVPWPAEQIEIRHGDHQQMLDFSTEPPSTNKV